MSTPIPTRPTPAVDIALAVCGGIITATASLSAITGLTEAAPWVPVALAVVAAITGAIQVALRGWVQAQTVPAADVLEAVSPDGLDVIAGPAADMAAPGTIVRPLT